MTSPENSSINEISSSLKAINNGIPFAEIGMASFYFNKAYELIGSIACDDYAALTERFFSAEGKLFETRTSLDEATDQLALYRAFINPDDSASASPPAAITTVAESEKTAPHAAQPSVDLFDETTSSYERRKEFQRGYGFALFSNVNDRVLARMARQPLIRIPDKLSNSVVDPWKARSTDISEALAYENPSGCSLFLATQALVQKVPDSYILRHHEGVTGKDLELSTKYSFKGGFEDLQFPWDFSSMVANHVAEQMVTDGILAKEVKDSFTLTDWANILSSDWFKAAIQEMAMTGGGVYGTVGGSLHHYRRHALTDHLSRSTSDLAYEGPVFITSNQGGKLSATVHPALRKKLRGVMHGSRIGSTGCPVARKATRITTRQLKTDHHLQAMLENGTLHIVEGREDSEYVRVTQTDTTISRTLDYTASELRKYDSKYGTPQLDYPRSVNPLVEKTPRVAHRRRTSNANLFA